MPHFSLTQCMGLWDSPQKTDADRLEEAQERENKKIKLSTPKKCAANMTLMLVCRTAGVNSAERN